MDDQRRCQLCGFYCTLPELPCVPSQACDACYLKIAEQLRGTKSEPRKRCGSSTGTPDRFELLKRFNELLERLLKALALDNRAEFDKLSQAYLIGNRGAYSRRAH